MALHSYGTNSESWWQWLAPRLPRAGQVLEVGAGTGELWRQIAHGPVTLVDFSSAMCSRLRQLPNARVARADASALPFAGAAFDTVIANHMLYHVDDPALALREFARVLTDGGRLAVAVNGREHMAELEEFGSPARTPQRLNDFSAETAPSAIAEVFDNVTVDRYPSDLAVPAAEPILAYLDSWTPLTPTERAAAKARIQSRIDNEGAFHEAAHTVLITARLTH